MFFYTGFFLIFLIFIWPFLKNNLGAAINWNTGIDNQFFLRSRETILSLESLKHVIIFYYSNLVIVFESMLSPLASEIHPKGFIGHFFLISFLIGVILLIKSKVNIESDIGILFSLIFIIWLILIFTNTLTLSPTRHSLIFTGIVLIPSFKFINFSNYYLLKFLNLKNNYYLLHYSFICFWIIFFLYSYNEEINIRIDQLNEVEINNKLINDNINHLMIVDSSIQFSMMNLLKNNFNIIDANIWTSKNIDKFKILNLKQDFNKNQYVNIALLSAHECLNTNFFKQKIEGIFNTMNIFNNYKFHFEHNECLLKNTEIEWSRLTKNGKNIISYNIINVKKNNL